MTKESSEQQKGYSFGTFKGVFTPSILTVLGVIMYLRMGWVLGNVGLPGTLLIVTLASAITFLTGLSLAALATNMKVGGGGAYYIISRSLGVEIGAAIGLPLFLALALGISFYISGFSESVVSIYPFLSPKLVGVVTLAVLALVAYVSADFALRTQFFIMVLVALSLVSFFAGHSPDISSIDLTHVPFKVPFWAVFAVFFPAVTGILSGVAMSGDLKNPGKSLPLGTISVVLTGFVIYMAVPIFLFSVVKDNRILLTDLMVFQKVARWGNLVLYGLWAASLSSAVGCMLGAPRTLQALANDRVLFRFFGKCYGKGKEPRIASAIVFLIALAGIMLGDLNLIAPLITMFFLTAYGLLNLSAGLEDLLSNPSWRPKFKVPSMFSMVGFFACLATMLMIDAGATLMAFVVCGGVYYAMKRRSLRARWGDMRYGIMMLWARSIIYRMASQKFDERTWRPNILVLSGVPSQRWYLIELADAISSGQSFVTVAAMLPDTSWSAERADSLNETITQYLKKHDVSALVHVFSADNHVEGAQQLIQNYGFGSIVPNTILIGETTKSENYVEFARLIQIVFRTQKNLVIVREELHGDESIEESGRSNRIDVWWRGGSQNIFLILALAYMIKESTRWTGSRLMLKMIVDSSEGQADARNQLLTFVKKERIGAEIDVLIRDNRSVFEIIRDSSKDAAIVFLGLRYPTDEESPETYSMYYRQLLADTNNMPVTALVMAAENVDFQRIFESGIEQDVH